MRSSARSRTGGSSRRSCSATRSIHGSRRGIHTRERGPSSPARRRRSRSSTSSNSRGRSAHRRTAPSRSRCRNPVRSSAPPFPSGRRRSTPRPPGSGCVRVVGSARLHLRSLSLAHSGSAETMPGWRRSLDHLSLLGFACSYLRSYLSNDDPRASRRGDTAVRAGVVLRGRGRPHRPSPDEEPGDRSDQKRYGDQGQTRPPRGWNEVVVVRFGHRNAPRVVQVEWRSSTNDLPCRVGYGRLDVEPGCSPTLRRSPLRVPRSPSSGSPSPPIEATGFRSGLLAVWADRGASATLRAFGGSFRRSGPGPGQRSHHGAVAARLPRAPDDTYNADERT